MPKYWVRVTRDNQANIISLYSPDLESELLENIEIKTNFRSHTRKMLISRFKDINKILLPKTFEELEQISLTSLQHWEPFEINLKKKYGSFSKILPGAGHVFNVLAILTAAFITYMALHSVSNKESNTDNNRTVLSILGAVFTSIVGFFIYVVSDSSDALVQIGHRMDNLFRRNNSTQLTKRKNNFSFTFNCSTAKYLALSVGAGGSVITNLTILAIRQYQEVILLAERYLELNEALTDSEREQRLELIKWLIIIPNIVASSYCLLAFQGSFARDLVIKVVNYKPKQNISERVQPLSEFENNSLSSRLEEVTNNKLLTKGKGEESLMDTKEESKEPLLFLQSNKSTSFKDDQLELVSSIEGNKSFNSMIGKPPV